MSGAVHLSTFGRACGPSVIRRVDASRSASFRMPPPSSAIPTADQQVIVPDSVRNAFNSLADSWLKETRFLSSSTDIAKHPAYRAVVAMGWHAVPIMLERLQRAPELWFAALVEITGDNPVDPTEVGDVNAMAHRWIQWGAKRGYVA